MSDLPAPFSTPPDYEGILDTGWSIAQWSGPGGGLELLAYEGRDEVVFHIFDGGYEGEDPRTVFLPTQRDRNAAWALIMTPWEEYPDDSHPADSPHYREMVARYAAVRELQAERKTLREACSDLKAACEVALAWFETPSQDDAPPIPKNALRAAIAKAREAL